MGTRQAEKQTALDWVEANRARLSDFHLAIWSYAEPAWREYKSARAYSELLREEGFDVEEGSGGMPTAFVANYGEGSPCWELTPSTTPSPARPSNQCRFGRRGRDFIRGQQVTPTRIRCSG